MTIDREPSPPAQALNTAAADEANSAGGDEGRSDDGDSGEMGDSGDRVSDSATVVPGESLGSGVRYRGRAGAVESDRWLGGSQCTSYLYHT